MSGTFFESILALHQNYPNPFNPTTNIEFTLTKPGQVKLEIFNLLGQIVAMLVNGELQAGVHKINFNADGLPNGAYFYRLSTGGYTEMKKMLLLK